MYEEDVPLHRLESWPLAQSVVDAGCGKEQAFPDVDLSLKGYFSGSGVGAPGPVWKAALLSRVSNVKILWDRVEDVQLDVRLRGVLPTRSQDFP